MSERERKGDWLHSPFARQKVERALLSLQGDRSWHGAVEVFLQWCDQVDLDPRQVVDIYVKDEEDRRFIQEVIDGFEKKDV